MRKFRTLEAEGLGREVPVFCFPKCCGHIRLIPAIFFALLLHLNISSSAALGTAAKGCVALNACTLTCTQCQANSLQKTLEDQYLLCKGNFSLSLYSCAFPASDLHTRIFDGKYVLKELIIDSCDIWTIMDGVFAQNTTATLESLALLRNPLDKLKAMTFQGLKELKYLQLISERDLGGTDFLRLLNGTLQYAQIQFQAKRSQNPGEWLGNGIYGALKVVNFSSNNFSVPLTAKSFVTLTAVQQLNLSSCSIAHLPSGIFDPLMSTLMILDLSKNQLTTLDGEWLSAIGRHELHLELFDNEWNCSCDNGQLFIELQTVDMLFKKEPVCLTPIELANVTLKIFAMECGNIQQNNTTTTLMDIEHSSENTSPIADTTTAEPNSSTTDWGTSAAPLDTIPTINDYATDNTTISSSNATRAPTSTMPYNTTSTAHPTSSTLPILHNPITINCRCNTHDEIFSQFIRNYDMLFSISTVTPSVVEINVGHDMNKYGLVYFNFKNITRSIEGSGNRNEKLERGAVVTKKQIFGLEWNQTYVFCVIPDFELRISPFNCHAHHHLVFERQREAWLGKQQRVMFYGLVALGVLLALIVGGVIVFYALRYNPTWLCGSKRLWRGNRKSKKVLLLPKNTDEQCRALPFLYGNANNSDYLAYYHNCHAIKKRSVQFAERLAPGEAAPRIPKRPASSAYLSPIVENHYAESLPHATVNLYEPVDYYEQVL